MTAKLITKSLVMIIVITASLWAGNTSAFFIRASVVENNYLRAGRVSVALHPETGSVDLHKVVTEHGYTEIYTLAITNDGTVPVVFRLFAEDSGSPQPQQEFDYLPQVVTITVKQQSLSIMEAKLSTLIQNGARYQWLHSGSENIVIASGETVNLTLEFKIDPSVGDSAKNEAFEGMLYVEAAESNQQNWSATAEAIILHYRPGAETASETTTAVLETGSSFNEISHYMITLIREHYQSTGSYGRSWGDYRYTDIGLMPSDWQLPVNRVYYTPGGSRLMVRPEEGFAFLLKAQDGTLKLLKASYNWNLIYDDLSEKWYYHSIAETNLVDIDTLEIINE
jgi:hypothetical protein